MRTTRQLIPSAAGAEPYLAPGGTLARFVVISDGISTDDALEGASVFLAAGSQFWRRRATW